MILKQRREKKSCQRKKRVGTEDHFQCDEHPHSVQQRIWKLREWLILIYKKNYNPVLTRVCSYKVKIISADVATAINLAIILK